MHIHSSLHDAAHQSLITRWAPRVLAALGALLAGLGIVFWVAANWPGLGRGSKFVVLQALAVVPALIVFAWPARHPARSALGLLTLLAIGALFAFFGQTFQTGADPWQLFALWAVLGLPLALAIRSNIVWMPWIVIVMTGISLWAYAHVGRTWQIRPSDIGIHLLAWLAGAAVVLAMLPRLAPWTGAGAWAKRLAVLLLLLMVVGTGLGVLFTRSGLRVQGDGGIALQYLLALLLTLGLGLVFSARRSFDLTALSFVALALDTLLLAGVVRWATDSASRDFLGMVLLIGLTAAGLLAGTVMFLMRMSRTRSSEVAAQDTAATNSAPDPSGQLSTHASNESPRPWPVVLITAVGAWVTTVPLVALVVLVFGESVFNGGLGALVLGLSLLGAAVWVLRIRGLHLFLEQLAVPVLISGLVLMGIAFFNLMPSSLACLALAATVLIVAALIDVEWLRVLLGMSAAGLSALGLTNVGGGYGLSTVPWQVSWHLLVAVWLVVQLQLHRAALRPWVAATLDAVSAGWIVLVLLGMVHASGSTFMLGPLLGGFASPASSMGGMHDGLLHRIGVPLLRMGSPLLAAAAMGLAWRRWPGLRQLHFVLPALVVLMLASYLSMLGATLLVLVVAAMGARQRIAVLAALAALWIVGSFYYLLSWPLATKAMVMVAAGLMLAIAAWLLLRESAEAWSATQTQANLAGSATPMSAWKLLRWGLPVSALFTILSAQIAIHDKETLIARGQPVFVQLAPRDPRSRMQGDFMALAQTVPSVDAEFLSARKPMVLARCDARGIAQILRVLRMDEPASLAADELLIELTPKDGRWVIASDAWYFKEGEAARWERARFAEYRITPEGRALLVNLRGPDLEPL